MRHFSNIAGIRLWDDVFSVRISYPIGPQPCSCSQPLVLNDVDIHNDKLLQLSGTIEAVERVAPKSVGIYFCDCKAIVQTDELHNCALLLLDVRK